MKKKIAVSAIALVLVLCCAIGGTLAWLTDETASIENVFTVGNVKITLTETKGNFNSGKYEFKMVPGQPDEKDPTVTVSDGSEACYLFVKVEEKNNDLSDDRGKYIIYDVLSDWAPVVGTTNVYYYTGAVTNGTPYSIIGYTDSEDIVQVNKVLYNSAITNADMDAAKLAAPTLTFTAYAVQSEGFADAQAAWDATFGA